MVHPAPARQHYNVTLGILIFAGIAFALQQTMIVPALPILQREFDTSAAWAAWVLTGFLLSASVATPLMGKLGDQYGKERMLVISLSLFLCGSIGAIFAWHIGALIGFRILQGTGAAVFPLAFAIIKDEFPPEKVGTAIGAVSAVFGVGGGLGLSLSGVLIDHLGWRWLFIVGATVVAAAVVLVHLFVPESPIKTPSRLDIPGALLLSVGLLALLVALTEGEHWGWTSPPLLGLFAASFVALLAWGIVELRVPEPLVDMRMLANRPVLFANLTGLIAGFALFGSFVLVPSLLQLPAGLPPALARLADYGFGASATETGLYLLPAAVTGFFTGPLSGVIGSRWGPKWPLCIGMTLGGLGLTILAEWHEEPWHIVAGMLVLGGGLPMTFAAMANIIVDSVRPTETGVATGMNTVMRTVGGVIGGQAGAAILTAKTIGDTPVPAESAFTTAFWIGAAASAVAVLVALMITPISPRRRAALRTRSERREVPEARGAASTGAAPPRPGS
ncbi:MAG TPA: MFS transporter [Gaiellaceae bacterium]|nr:MFS transporter [Gaiellaceae bacterium]